ncbi:MAG: hypothetical protein PHP26_09415 [Syntrophomonas sp.]|uniref:hypothetical protein n=1 Tax=Syntrophomonas sp. TaxID=2053627 RepID=UPI002616EFFB|nr:hypothetical protein [Syntrophomonas sp.]MDD2511465.1 hypothetical protein [Syntrophomonas sp.]MDD3880189.1 hypothetical protein [Syntrophomonas sp.]MDD4626930.1 hypothetical protein [Syntrophomonas sp.]
MKRSRWTIIILMTLLLLGLAASARSIEEYYIKSQLDPQIELQATIKKMATIDSYRYQLTSSFTVAERKEVISQVKGEKSGANTHIKGEMVNTAIDIYYIDRTIYNYDAFSQKWLVIESDANKSEELLISELNPLSNFRFKQIAAVEKLRFEEVDGVECLVVGCRPSIESQLLESLWKGFEYSLWLDYKERVVKKAALTAVNKKAPDTRLNLKVEFSDWNKKIDIRPPDTSSAKKN